MPNCSFLAKFMAMSMDEKAAKIIGQVVEQRILSWPASGSPDVLRDSTFLLSHAVLVQVCAPSAPLMSRSVAPSP